MQNTRILVTGGAGFVGSHVAEALLARGEEIILVDEINDYYNVEWKHKNISHLQQLGGDRLIFRQGDIADREFMKGVYHQYRPRRVVHMAARAGVRPSIEKPFLYIHSNIVGTTALLELSRKYGNDSFVFASSSSVYGNNPKGESSETDVVDAPLSQYAATKKSCELIAHTYYSLYHMNITGLRFFTVYGPRGRMDMMPMQLIERISHGLEVYQFGDGSSARDYTYIDDVVDGVIRALDRPNGFQIFNLGNGRPCKLSDFIHVVEREIGQAAKIRIYPEQPGDVKKTCANIEKARQMLGYEPQIPIEEGIRRTVQWYKERD